MIFSYHEVTVYYVKQTLFKPMNKITLYVFVLFVPMTAHVLYKTEQKLSEHSKKNTHTEKKTKYFRYRAWIDNSLISSLHTERLALRITVANCLERPMVPLLWVNELLAYLNITIHALAHRWDVVVFHTRYFTQFTLVLRCLLLPLAAAESSGCGWVGKTERHSKWPGQDGTIGLFPVSFPPESHERRQESVIELILCLSVIGYSGGESPRRPMEQPI